MKQETLHHQGNGRIHTISDALNLLNAAADDSADEIRGMIKNDYKKLKRILADAKPEVNAAIGEFQQAAVDSVTNAKQKATTLAQDAAKKVDDSARENVWKCMGATAAMSAIAGFLLGRKINQNEVQKTS